MALFTALVAIGLILWHAEFLKLALTNIWINGIIIGTTIFGIGLCFTDIFRLIPEYRWMKKYFANDVQTRQSVARAAEIGLPPRLLRPVAIMLNRVRAQNKNYISTQTLDNFLNIIMSRFEDNRESVRYVTNTLIFLGLLGTFWGLIHTVGGFADMVAAMNFEDENLMSAVQAGLAKPMNGMSVAFASSLLGLGGSLIVGFLGLQTTLAQNALFRELEESLADRARLFGYLGAGQRGEETALPYIQATAKELTKTATKLDKVITKVKKK